MNVALLGEPSPFLAEARALERAGRLRLVAIGPRPGPLEVGTEAADQALVGTSVPLFYLKELLRRCRAGRLGEVRLLLDGPCPPADRVGFRERPWLGGVLVPVGVAPPWTGPLPAPLVPVAGLADALARFGEPPVRFAPVPSPFPAELQVETTSVCRAGCPFCPRSFLDVADAFMDEALFADVVEQCAEGRPDNLELYLNGEPLADPRLERLADRAKAACPGSLVSIVTHVDALTEARAPSLAGCGLDLVFVSLNPLGHLDEAALGPRLERLARIARVLEAGSCRLVVVSLVDLIAEGSRGRLRRLLAAHGLAFEAFRATTRAGDVDLDRFATPGPAPPPGRCERAFTRAFVRCDGELVLCCEDFRHRRSFGSVRERPIAELWTGPAYQEVRQELLAGRPRPPCDRCAMGGILADRADAGRATL